MQETQTQTRVVTIEKAPSVRLFQPGRFRTFKLPEARWWQDDTHAVRELVADGWRLVRVTLEWSKGVPGFASWREPLIRELTGCHGDCEVEEAYGQPGRGKTTFTLER